MQTGTAGPNGQAEFAAPQSVTVDVQGNVYVTEYGGLAKVDTSCRVTTLTTSVVIAGYSWSYSEPQVANTAPNGIATDASGNVYLADVAANLIYKIDPGGTVTTLAGNGNAGYWDANGLHAEFNHPAGVAVDSKGFIYVADTGNNRIRKIDPSGNVTTLAGGSVGDFDGSGGPGGSAEFNQPTSLALDPAGNVIVADLFNNRIRKVDPAGNVTTLAGLGNDHPVPFADGPAGGTERRNSTSPRGSPSTWTGTSTSPTPSAIAFAGLLRSSWDTGTARALAGDWRPVPLVSFPGGGSTFA